MDVEDDLPHLAGHVIRALALLLPQTRDVLHPEHDVQDARHEHDQGQRAQRDGGDAAVAEQGRVLELEGDEPDGGRVDEGNDEVGDHVGAAPVHGALAADALQAEEVHQDVDVEGHEDEGQHGVQHDDERGYK